MNRKLRNVTMYAIIGGTAHMAASVIIAGAALTAGVWAVSEAAHAAKGWVYARR